MRSKQANPYPLRLPQELLETVKRLAKENRRSINSQIIIMLEEYLKSLES